METIYKMEATQILKPIEAGNAKKNMHLLLNGKTCKIVDLSGSKTGKHGHLKVAITGIDIFSGNKIMQIYPGHFSLYEVEVQKKECQLVNVSGEDIEVLNEDNEIEFFNKSEMLEQLQKEFSTGKEVTVSILTGVETSGQDNVVVTKIVSSKSK